MERNVLGRLICARGMRARQIYELMAVLLGQGQGGQTAQETTEPGAHGGEAQAESSAGRAARCGPVHWNPPLWFFCRTRDEVVL